MTAWPKADGFALDEIVVVVGAIATTCETGVAAVLAEKLVVAAYEAEIAWLPAARALVVTTQLPPEVSEQVPTTWPSVPSVTVTVPVGIAPVEEATATVNETDWPWTDGFRPDATVVVVVAGTIVWTTVADEVDEKFASPP